MAGPSHKHANVITDPHVDGMDEQELVRLIRDIRSRAEQPIAPVEANNGVKFDALLAAQRAVYRHRTPNHARPPESHTNAVAPATPRRTQAVVHAPPSHARIAVLHAHQNHAELPTDARPVVVDFKADSQTVALLFATMRLATFLLLRLLMWFCGGVRGAAEWCEISLTPPVQQAGCPLLQKNQDSSLHNISS
ncbi:hypothetical protein EJ05DRAFT_222359 [Pseudovirgaria hyperparasitica]|uniref:Uncharacterized protein n=1 Tax=Pseudovirgaria hyperparasitica TaxID=470096 RepID=A0A6A6VTM3_9PEZI|nr:uncharacterized protein EJ05DRAFT_222359 [Pseudovirgaria hyperparasitica]KAF2753563.1 hypothetical protein EJ05DRAFT_222359 [Pseudovirgaria hyperparasitica]